MLVGAVCVLCGLPGAAVEEAFAVPVLGEEQPTPSSALSRQTQLMEKRDDSPAR